MTPSRSQYIHASRWPWLTVFWGMPLACALIAGFESNAATFLSFVPHTLWGALAGYIAASFMIGMAQKRRGALNGPFRVGDLARILVRRQRDTVARVCEVWTEQQWARLEFGPETQRFGEDTFAWYQISRENDAEL